VIVPSDFSAAEVTRLFPSSASKIRRIYLGVSSEFYPDLKRAALVRERFQLPSEYLLHVGDLHNRRNIPRIIQVGQKLEMPVVLVGRIFDPDLGLPTGIRPLSDLSLEDLRGVYSGASLFLYASFYEGFGLPLLEAMACGVPVVAARRASIPEVCGDAAILVEPNVESLAEGVRAALEQRSSWVERGFERASQFSWRATAEKTRRIYQELLT
jgi:alpha-1,3-rhamnosyl/mannosyltransferase